LIEYETAGNGISLRAELAGDLPLILGHRIELQQVFVNLIMNAIEAINASSEGPREILVRSRKEGPNQVIASVQDSGVGIEPDKVNPPFRALLHHEGCRNGTGAIDQPLNHRNTWGGEYGRRPTGAGVPRFIFLSRHEP